MRPDKRLGQHFLRDMEVLQDIAGLADVAHSSGVLEIGPGEGALTAFLVEAGEPVAAIDKDPRAVAAIAERFGERVRVVEGDAVEADLEGLLPAPDHLGRRPVIVGNLPYNAGSAIFRRLLELGDQVARMVLMFQREVAQRIVADPGTRSYGLPSVMTALTANAWLVREVPPAAFVPRPKVHSAVVLVEPHDAAALSPSEMDPFSRFVAQVFQARRKMLRSALPDPAAAEELGIDLTLRPEQLTPDQLLQLYWISGSPT